jgi:hypothetical protein
MRKFPNYTSLLLINLYLALPLTWHDWLNGLYCRACRLR